MSNAPPPTSVPPNPPTSGGNRTYAILAVLLLLGMGGLLYFKFKGDPPAPDTTPTVPSAAPTFNRDEEDIPPPPEPLPEAGPPDAGKLDKTGSGTSNGCAASACGEASTAIANALTLRGRQARRCYESQLANDPSLHVKMSINVKVGTNGSLCSSSVTETSNDAVSRCVLNFFRSGSYPAPKGCIANVTVPLNFVPR